MRGFIDHRWQVGATPEGSHPVRIATLIVGLLIGLLLFIQSWLSMAFGDTSFVEEETSSAGAAGFIMALMWLLGSALVISFPRVSLALFGLSAPLGLFVPTGDFEDLRFHGAVAIVLAAMAYFGWRGKRVQDREKTTERLRQADRDALLVRMAQIQGQKELGYACRQCGTVNEPNVKFCRECGSSMQQPVLVTKPYERTTGTAQRAPERVHA